MKRRGFFRGLIGLGAATVVSAVPSVAVAKVAEPKAPEIVPGEDPDEVRIQIQIDRIRQSQWYQHMLDAYVQRELNPVEPMWQDLNAPIDGPAKWEGVHLSQPQMSPFHREEIRKYFGSSRITDISPSVDGKVVVTEELQTGPGTPYFTLPNLPLKVIPHKAADQDKAEAMETFVNSEAFREWMKERKLIR